MLLEQKNKVAIGDTIEIVMPSGKQISREITSILDENGTAIESAPHAKMRFQIFVGEEVEPYSMIQKPTA